MKIMSMLLVAPWVLVLTSCTGTDGVGGGGGAHDGSDALWVPGRASVPATVTAAGTVLEDRVGPRLCLGMIRDSFAHCRRPSTRDSEWERSA